MQTTLSTVGNYTIYATVNDSNGSTATAFASVDVTTGAPIPLLQASATYQAASAISSGGATYGFVAAVSGGVAPYTIQWNFGDGAQGSGLPGGTTLHTYTVSGRFTAILTVTDAHGIQAHSTVGPILVSLPAPAAPSATPWWATEWVLAAAAAVGLVCAAVLAVTLTRLAQRREALNWLHEIEERPGSSEPAPRSR